MSGIFSWSRVLAKALSPGGKDFYETVTQKADSVRAEAVAKAFPSLIMPTNWQEFDQYFQKQLIQMYGRPQRTKAGLVDDVVELCGPHPCRKPKKKICEGYTEEHASAITGMLLSVITANFKNGQQGIAVALAAVRQEVNHLIDHASNGCNCGDEDDDHEKGRKPKAIKPNR